MPRVRVGSAEIDLTLKTAKFTRAVEQTRKQVKTMKDRFDTAARSVLNLNTAMAAIAAGAALRASKAIFDLGAAVEETGSKFDTVFGTNNKAVQSALNQFSALAGLSKRAAQEVTATTGAIVQGFGIVGRQSAALSVEVTQLAADLASFNNVPVAETARAIQAGLTGEMESLKRLGIAVLDADVKKRALVMSGKALTSQLTAGDIVMARFALITERAGVQVGDLQRTSATAAAEARTLGAELTTLKETMANQLLPVGARVVGWLNDMIAKARELLAPIRKWNLQQQTVAAAIAGTDEELKASLDALNAYSNSLRDAAAGTEDLGSALAGAGRGAAPAVLPAITDVNAKLLEARLQLPRVSDAFEIAADGVERLANETARAANQQSRLNSLQSKFSAISRAVSFIPGLGGFGGIVGQVAGAVGAASGLQENFAPVAEAAGGGSTIVVSVPAARDPMTFARDAQWQRAIAETNRNLRANGALP